MNEIDERAIELAIAACKHAVPYTPRNPRSDFHNNFQLVKEYYPNCGILHSLRMHLEVIGRVLVYSKMSKHDVSPTPPDTLSGYVEQTGEIPKMFDDMVVEYEPGAWLEYMPQGEKPHGWRSRFTLYTPKRRIVCPTCGAIRK